MFSSGALLIVPRAPSARIYISNLITWARLAGWLSGVLAARELYAAPLRRARPIITRASCNLFRMFLIDSSILCMSSVASRLGLARGLKSGRSRGCCVWALAAAAAAPGFLYSVIKTAARRALRSKRRAAPARHISSPNCAPMSTSSETL